MEVKNRGIIPLTTLVLFLLLISGIFPLSSSELDQNQVLDTNKPSTTNSAVVFPIQGNVYPLGYYTVTLAIGNPPKAFVLDIDSGSDLSWVECDAPCRGCIKPRDLQYKPSSNLLKCGDPLCAAVQSISQHHCANPNDQCDYEIEYADHGSSLGVLVQDSIPLRLTNGTNFRANLVFGCGYDQTHTHHTAPPSTAGVLGLGNGKSSILSQLRSQNILRNVVGHCLSSRGGGFLFFGDKLIPQSGIVWTSILQQSSSQKHYMSGPADLIFNGRPTPIKGLNLIFDSGSSYTYLNSQAYRALVDLVTNDLKGKPLQRATEDPSLPICWKGAKPFRTLSDVSVNTFKPLTLTFTRSRNLQLQLPPQAYLIVTQHANVCLGILDGTQAGLGNLNVIGDISLQDKLVIYDNENQRIGWTPANCDRRVKL